MLTMCRYRRGIFARVPISIERNNRRLPEHSRIHRQCNIDRLTCASTLPNTAATHPFIIPLYV